MHVLFGEFNDQQSLTKNTWMLVCGLYSVYNTTIYNNNRHVEFTKYDDGIFPHSYQFVMTSISELMH